MSAVEAYLLGMATLPTLWAVWTVSILVAVRLTRWLCARGIAIEARVRSRTERVSDYILRNNIWWERSWGPVFAGGWYHDEGYPTPRPRFNRWVGFGLSRGPCLTVVRLYDLSDSP